MAPTASPKKSKPAEKKPSKSKEKATSISESFPSKPLKRKEDTVNDEELATEKQAPKKAKKNLERPSKLAETKRPDTMNIPDKKKTKANVSQSGPASNSISFPKKPMSQKSSKTSKATAPERDDSDNDSSGQEGSGQGNAESDEHLHGFSTDEDSSDEESEASAEFDMGKLPTIAKDDETVKRKLDKAKRQPTEDRGVMFIGRLPRGFFEDQLRAYFSQFGDVTRLRVSRNKKTGKSKHYAFIEFDSSAVAKIVAETMDNYLIMGHILQCKLIPKEKVHPELWVGANRKWRVVPRDRIARVQHNKSRTAEEQKHTAKRLLKRQAQRKRKLAELGINYDIDAAGYKKARLANV